MFVSKIIVRFKDYVRRSGRSRSSTYSDIGNGTCVPTIHIGARAVGFLEHEIDALLAARAAGKSDQEMRLVVAELVAQRQTSPVQNQSILGAAGAPQRCEHPNLVDGRKQFWADVRAGKRRHPRKKGGGEADGDKHTKVTVDQAESKVRWQRKSAAS